MLIVWLEKIPAPFTHYDSLLPTVITAQLLISAFSFGLMAGLFGLLDAIRSSSYLAKYKITLLRANKLTIRTLFYSIIYALMFSVLGLCYYGYQVYLPGVAFIITIGVCLVGQFINYYLELLEPHVAKHYVSRMTTIFSIFLMLPTFLGYLELFNVGHHGMQFCLFIYKIVSYVYIFYMGTT